MKRPNPCFVIQFGLALIAGSIVGCQGNGTSNSFSRIPPPGTWGSASNSYYSLPNGSWTPAAPGTAVGSGIAPAPPTAPLSSGAKSSTGSTLSDPPSVAFTSTSTSNEVRTASALSPDNPVKIAVYSDDNSDGTEVIPANAPITSAPTTTTVPSSQLPWRSP
jgi:hypothetical protein